jgi:hypothetical protein
LTKAKKQKQKKIFFVCLKHGTSFFNASGGSKERKKRKNLVKKMRNNKIWKINISKCMTFQEFIGLKGTYNIL